MFSGTKRPLGGFFVAQHGGGDVTDDKLIARWQQVKREHGDYVRKSRGRVRRDLLDEIASLRREGYRRGIDMNRIPPAPRAAAVIQRELRRIERSMARQHRRAYTRAQATTREARLGQLARSRDALLDELRRSEAADGE